MKIFWRSVREIIHVGLLRGWPGDPCPVCFVRPALGHEPDCPVGKWDGGTWA